jgi:hypothetical protein
MKTLVWVSCIGMLSLAYEDFLHNEFSIFEVQGVVSQKWREGTVKNSYGNYFDESEYWVRLNDEKIVVPKRVYQEIEVKDLIKLSKTKHGMLVQKR